MNDTHSTKKNNKKQHHHNTWSLNNHTHKAINAKWTTITLMTCPLQIPSFVTDELNERCETSTKGKSDHTNGNKHTQIQQTIEIEL
jgi:hypothetical protein